MKQISSTDKPIGIMLLFCFIFWLLSKTEVSGFVLFGVVYEMGVFPMIGVAIGGTIYFLYKWIKNKFTFNKIYLYGFLLGILTLLIMRFVYFIETSGITLWNE